VLLLFFPDVGHRLSLRTKREQAKLPRRISFGLPEDIDGTGSMELPMRVKKSVFLTSLRDKQNGEYFDDPFDDTRPPRLMRAAIRTCDHLLSLTAAAVIPQRHVDNLANPQAPRKRVLRGVMPAGVARSAFVLRVMLPMSYGLQALNQDMIQALLPREEDKQGEPTKHDAHIVLSGVVQTVSWLLSSALILRQLGVDVTALTAGISISGLTLGLAMQKAMQDLVASMTVLLEKPYKVGDYVEVDARHKGYVKSIGLRSTVMTTVEDAVIHFPNSEISRQAIINWSNDSRSVRQTFRIALTPRAQECARQIPSLVRDVVERDPARKFHVCGLVDIGGDSTKDNALCFVFFWKHLASGNTFDVLRTRTEINFGLIDTFREHGLTWAVSASEVHLSPSQAQVDFKDALLSTVASNQQQELSQE